MLLLAAAAVRHLVPTLKPLHDHGNHGPGPSGFNLKRKVSG
jgi:hypothetical protein